MIKRAVAVILSCVLLGACSADLDNPVIGATSGGPVGALPAAGTTTSAANAMSAWLTKVEDDWNATQAAVTKIGADSGTPTPAVLIADCQQLALRVTTMRAKPAAPDARIATEMDAALTAYTTATTSCAASNFPAASAALQDGSTHISAITALITAGH